MNILKNKLVGESNSKISRRKFLGIGLAVAAASVAPRRILAAEETPLPAFFEDCPPRERKRLSLYNVYSHEELDIQYWKDGQYIPEALEKISHIFRDSRTGKVHTIHTELLDLLFSVQEKLKCTEPFHIVSGYRTPRSNALLRRHQKGVAKNSLHMYGKAVDIRLPGYNLRTLRRTAMSFRSGGVGYYPSSKFIHVDVGDVRYWWG